jgi:hypothetical protein
MLNNPTLASTVNFVLAEYAHPACFLPHLKLPVERQLAAGLRMESGSWMRIQITVHEGVSRFLNGRPTRPARNQNQKAGAAGSCAHEGIRHDNTSWGP